MEFDIILGMDRLAACHAYVDCCENRVIFRMKGIPKFIFKGIKERHSMPVISAMRNTRLLRQGYQDFLATFMKEHGVDRKFESIPVVKEYPEVFPRELTGLPPEREVEFLKDLISKTAPISKEPYRMAPAKKKNLRFNCKTYWIKDLSDPVYHLGECQYCLLKRRMEV